MVKQSTWNSGIGLVTLKLSFDFTSIPMTMLLGLFLLLDPNRNNEESVLLLKNSFNNAKLAENYYYNFNKQINYSQLMSYLQKV